MRVYSRSLNDVTAAVPEVVAAARALSATELIVDRRQLRDKLHGILSLLQGQLADNVA